MRINGQDVNWYRHVNGEWVMDHDAARARFPEAYVDLDGVLRWRVNKAVPPKDCVNSFRLAGLSGWDQDATDAARDADTAAFLAEYRASYRGPSAEERMEARAAHGPGVELVNVLTGHRWTT